MERAMGIEPTSEVWENCCLRFQIVYEAINLERERPTRKESAFLFVWSRLWTKTPAFCGLESALDSARATESTRFMVEAVGIELTIVPRTYDFPFLLFSALNLAHRAFVALEIFALAAADITRFSDPRTLLVACMLLARPFRALIAP